MDNANAVIALKALDCLSAREIATAQNIANAATAGYRPLRVTFEDALKAAASESSASVQQFAPAITQAAAGGADAEVRLDLEMGTAAGTAGRYAAVLETLDRQLALQQLAITGNS